MSYYKSNLPYVLKPLLPLGCSGGWQHGVSERGRALPFTVSRCHFDFGSVRKEHLTSFYSLLHLNTSVIFMTLLLPCAHPRFRAFCMCSVQATCSWAGAGLCSPGALRLLPHPAALPLLQRCSLLCPQRGTGFCPVMLHLIKNLEMHTSSSQTSLCALSSRRTPYRITCHCEVL